MATSSSYPQGTPAPGPGAPRVSRVTDARIRSKNVAEYYPELAAYRRAKSQEHSTRAPLLDIIRHRDKQLALARRGAANETGRLDRKSPSAADHVGDAGLLGTSADILPKAYPWVSLVLGSGALPGPDLTAEPTVDLRVLVTEGLSGLGVTARGRQLLSEHALPELAQEFVMGLAAAKLGLSSPVNWLPADVLTDNPGSRALGVRAAVIAAMTTRLYAEAIARTRVLMNPDREVFHINRSDPQVQPLLRDVVSPLVDFAELALPDADSVSSRSAAAFVLLAQQVSSSISDGKTVDVDRSHVELLSAFAWYFLTEDTAIYPGWSDILLFQAADMIETHERMVDHPGLRRPYLRNIGQTEEISWITRRLERVTTRAWERGTQPDEVYSIAADILLQQAAVRSSFLKGTSTELVNLPLATAFVASFDVELEMALWRRIVDGAAERAAGGLTDSFAVIAPFFATLDDEAAQSVLNTSFLWGYRIIRPKGATVEDFLAAIKGEKGQDWHMLSEESRRDLSRIPIVVHLSGAPLLSEADGRSFGLDTEKVDVQHAILLDEYRALVEMATGFTGDQAAVWRNLVASSGLLDRIGERFWLFIGAQLADPGVRLRLLAQEMISVFRGGSDDGTMQSGDADSGFARGVMVNEWSPASERAAFTWQAIDVVKGSASDLVADLIGIRDEVTRLLEAGTQAR